MAGINSLICFSLFLVILITPQSNGARILGLFTAPSKSHLLIHTAIIDALVEKGHNATVVTTGPILKNNINYRHINLDIPGFSPDQMQKSLNNGKPSYADFMNFVKTVTGVANDSIQHPTMRQLMEEETFDLVILGYFFNEFQLGVAAHFKCPVVISFMTQSITPLNQIVGNPREVAYVPNLFQTGESKGFFSRVKNFVSTMVFDEIAYPLISDRQQAGLYDANFPADKYPSFDEMKKNVSLVFVNHHFSQGPIRPNVPAMVEIGGIQIKEKPAPLPEDLKKILDNAKNGVVYFSFGSNVQGKYLDKVKAKLMFDILSKLKQTVLWKWDDSPPPGQSPNIHYKTWLPQDDILAHPNVRLFITHGGAGSVVESQYHGVPMVGIPLFAEQFTNVDTMVKAGYGVGVEFATISSETFGNGVNEVLTNPVYRNNVQRFSKLYKDRPMTAKQTVVYWTEYILRHHGAPHMQSPAVHMNTLQLASLDVIGFLLAVIYIVYKVCKIVIMFIWSKLFSKKNKNSKNKKE
ncbi:UDP-glycosyltransferase UGT5-like isoform X1 [Episyrphus balteatus]|uniref:UDP-glycosyltransferase UGT5-like isoform X1 n=1 Tax=Episyrphus balteatus TaxID=286459 RepID=UPI002486BA8F|nr:UDP-glycosyltransferase UGT5-like isoform X1 [Episyrphus balteatus]